MFRIKHLKVTVALASAEGSHSWCFTSAVLIAHKCNISSLSTWRPHPQLFSYRMVISARAAASFVESGMDCPAPNHPDDMYLGAVAKRLEWGVVHSPLFHQVRIEYLFLASLNL